ncbi:MAG TPA: alkaline phosphatase family protein, partial [Candidatus Dormibacteraeota bacterium]
KVDRWGPGTRVPTIVISPLAKKGFVDHTQYDTTSILRTIEQRWDLPALESRDARATSLVNALDPNQAPAAGSGPSPGVAVIVLGALVVLAIAGLAAGILVRRGQTS